MESTPQQARSRNRRWPRRRDSTARWQDKYETAPASANRRRLPIPSLRSGDVPPIASGTPVRVPSLPSVLGVIDRSAPSEREERITAYAKPPSLSPRRAWVTRRSVPSRPVSDAERGGLLFVGEDNRLCEAPVIGSDSAPSRVLADRTKPPLLPIAPCFSVCYPSWLSYSVLIYYNRIRTV
jgi:hypothetical protein